MEAAILADPSDRRFDEEEPVEVKFFISDELPHEGEVNRWVRARASALGQRLEPEVQRDRSPGGVRIRAVGVVGMDVLSTVHSPFPPGALECITLVVRRDRSHFSVARLRMLAPYGPGHARAASARSYGADSCVPTFVILASQSDGCGWHYFGCCFVVKIFSLVETLVLGAHHGRTRRYDAWL